MNVFRNKRGGEKLLGFTLVDLLVALVVLGLLIAASIIFYNMYVSTIKDKEEQQAKGQLDTIKNLLNELELGEERTAHLTAPAGWHFVSFDEDNNFNGKFEKPDIFINSNTICICKDKNCEICQHSDLPLKSDVALVDIKIIADINITKLENHYDIKLAQIKNE